MAFKNNLLSYLFPNRNAKEIEGNLLLKDGSLHIRLDPRINKIGEKDNEKHVFDLRDIEGAVRDAVCELNTKGIYTYSSEAGGKGHSIEDFSYVVTRLTPGNSDIAEKNEFLLKCIDNYRGSQKKIFNYTDRARINFYVLGFNRENLNNKEVSKKFNSLVGLLGKQEDDLAGRGRGFRKDERPETAQYLSLFK